MSKVALVTDSTAYIPQDLVDKYHISVVPQILIWGEETFEDGVDILPAEFYERLENATIMPSSSQVVPATFDKIFGKLLEGGHDILAVLVSAKLSGTVDSAIQAREKYPNAPIEILDSNTTAMAMGFQVLEAARAAEAGGTLAECKELVINAKEGTGVVFAVNTLEFLHRGGRIGGGSRFLGTALNIKPILEVANGRVEALERVRTRKKSLLRLVELVEERIDGNQPVHLATLHANSPEDARQVLDVAADRLNAKECIFSDVSPVIGVHAGPGTVALAYLAGT
jgi:DegV family protein with EDD domain